jgi:hypothetical protein
MADSHSFSPAASVPTARQRYVRSRSRRASLECAVRFAVDVFFAFKYRSSRACALWCETERVWLGSTTYLDWALCDADIGIPWTVATALDAPENADELREAVRAELIAYWALQMASLPSNEHPCWLPLP